jgi:hypothetical protein
MKTGMLAITTATLTKNQQHETPPVCLPGVFLFRRAGPERFTHVLERALTNSGEHMATRIIQRTCRRCGGVVDVRKTEHLTGVEPT